MTLDLDLLSSWLRNSDQPDLYRGILGLDPEFSKRSAISDLFMEVAQIITRLFPNRIYGELVSPLDARIIVLKFSNHHETTREDMLLVLNARSG